MKERRYPIVNIGTVSILTIFVILCMVTFATLSYISASHDAKLGEQIASGTSAYYAAVEEANQKIAEADEKWMKEWQTTGVSSAGQKISFSVPIDSGTALFVELTSTSPSENNGRFYQVSRFARASTEEWQGQNTINLLKPGKEQ